ncbi:hypothetical protein GCM10023210_11740 [Chryseobacterium ginsengisoli]|uniref:Uncharacterized protein n=1 Tax=Chryseobacterium ginsengisoli TaxID=363853 RepID=A0ABP9M2V4_9FLAO
MTLDIELFPVDENPSIAITGFFIPQISRNFLKNQETLRDFLKVSFYFLLNIFYPN